MKRLYIKITDTEEFKQLAELLKEFTMQFSTQQIGKATINTTTQIKDKAREQVARDEQQIEQEELKK